MKNLLLIEDDKHLAEMYAKKFQNSGFEVTITKNGPTGIEEAKKNKYDVLVLDIMLPGISGIEVLELLRTDVKTAKIPVVIYTNSGDEEHKKKAMYYGADEYILKIDSTPESLCGAINKVVSRN
ncbi:response regulator [Patescibacteria group bacterium]|nr:response regulator [Patescibacteria group bacterium]